MPEPPPVQQRRWHDLRSARATPTSTARSAYGGRMWHRLRRRDRARAAAHAEQELSRPTRALIRDLEPLSPIHTARVETIATAALAVETPGEGFVEITREVGALPRADQSARRRAAALSAAHLGVAGDPGERRSGRAAPIWSPRSIASRRRTPAGCTTSKGPTTCRPTSSPCSTAYRCTCRSPSGELALGTWQGIYLAEHRARPHRREVVLQFVGSRNEPEALQSRPRHRSTVLATLPE